MLLCAAHGHPLRRVQAQELPHEVDSILLQLRARIQKGLEPSGFPLRIPLSPMFQLLPARPVGVAGGAKEAKDFEEGVHVTISGEERAYRGHLCHQAAS